MSNNLRTLVNPSAVFTAARLLATGALAVSLALVVASASAAPMSPATNPIAVAMDGGTDTFACAENSSAPIYTNPYDTAITVSLNYEHGCTTGSLSFGIRGGSLLPGCRILVSTGDFAGCQATVPAGAAIWLYQTGGKDTTGAGHSWRVDEPAPVTP